MNYIITFSVAMVPLVELRGAVPYAIATDILMRQTLIIGVVDNTLPVPVIFFSARRMLEWGADKPVISGFFAWCLKKGHNGGKKLAKTANDRGLFIALLFFVGTPIPGTGARTGTLTASILNWNFRQGVIAVMFDVILAGLIMGTLTTLGLGTFN